MQASGKAGQEIVVAALATLKPKKPQKQNGGLQSKSVSPPPPPPQTKRKFRELSAMSVGKAFSFFCLGGFRVWDFFSVFLRVHGHS